MSAKETGVELDGQEELDEQDGQLWWLSRSRCPACGGPAIALAGRTRLAHRAGCTGPRPPWQGATSTARSAS
jgi:hypothetical protein